MDTRTLMNYLHIVRAFRIYKPVLLFFSAIGALYLLFFSPPGNRLLSLAVEKALSSAFSTPIGVDDFVLTHDRFDLHFHDSQGNSISTRGGFSLLTLQMYAHYRIDCPANGGVNAINIPLKTEGSLSGGKAALGIQGTARIFEGDVVYRVQLHHFKLASLYAELNRISYEQLLHRLDYPSSTDTLLMGTIDLKGFERRSLEGSVRLATRTSRFEPTEILPDDDEPFDLRSFLADEFGRVRAFDVNVSLEASVEHAGVLEQFVSAHLAGPAAANATLQGDQNRLSLHATTALAQSDTTFTLSIDDLEPERIAFDVKHADVPQLFALFALPSPLAAHADAKGFFTAQGGKVEISLSQARTLPEVLKREYGITQPPLRFDAAIRADLSEKGVRYQGTLVSDLERLEFADSASHDQMLRELLKTFR